MRIIALTIAFTAIFFSLIKPVQAKGKRLKELQAMQESSYIMNFNWREFKRYVLQNSGEYQIILDYTIGENCDHCEVFESELSEVAYTYHSAGMHLDQDLDSKLPIFFAKIEFNQNNREAFLISEFNSAPILAIATKKEADQYKEEKKVIYDGKTSWVMSAQDVTEAGVLIEHVNRMTGNKLPIRYTMLRTAKGTILILIALGILFFLKDKLASLIQNRIVWFIGSAVVYLQCVGGVAFSLIHSMPTFRYGQDESGNLIVEEFFQRNGRGQYAGEGYICSFLMFVTASLLVVYTRLNKMEDGMKKEIICLLLAILGFIGFTVVNEIFLLKSPMFSSGFYPPNHYMRGPYSVDQGTNI
ncbi:unnamed protein product [Moneuplotes crassus]|uniref:Uncharacterized protein n=2 Tax=Euplotes crassus TaxID=5936 RepID=A0AAD1XII3_EUPCR|nr:unnamed protein product [Moneuplotes crassus]